MDVEKALLESSCVSGLIPLMYRDDRLESTLAYANALAIFLLVGLLISIGGEATFTDRDAASTWALPYIDAASAAGIVQGRTK